jgi:hypothetical protein
VDDQLVAPLPASEEVELGELESTAKSIANAAVAGGYSVRARRLLGADGLCVVGVAGGWGFRLSRLQGGTWDVIMYRPGWHVAPGNTVQLRAMLQSQTPTDLGKAA